MPSTPPPPASSFQSTSQPPSALWTSPGNRATCARPTERSAANLSTNDIIRIQVVSHLSDLLFDELQKIKLDGTPPSALRIRLAGLEHAAAIQRAMVDLLAGIPGEGTASPEDN